MDIDYAFLQKTLLFRTISEEEIMPLLLALQYRTTLFEKGETILSAGSIADSIGLIVSGGADIQLNDEWGNRTILSHISEGQYFAETYAMLDHAMLPVDVVATEDSKVLFLKADALKQDLPETDAQIAKMRSNMLSLALKKNLVLSGRIFHTAPKTIRREGPRLSHHGSPPGRNRDFRYSLRPTAAGGLSQPGPDSPL